MTASFLISIRDSVLALPSADRDRAAAVERNCSGPARPFFSQPFAMSGQLAGALDSVRFFFSRLIGVIQNSPRDRTKALGGISGVSRFARWLAVLIAPWIEND